MISDCDLLLCWNEKYKGKNLSQNRAAGKGKNCIKPNLTSLEIINDTQ